jgi:hypothetical protein
VQPVLSRVSTYLLRRFPDWPRVRRLAAALESLAGHPAHSNAARAAADPQEAAREVADTDQVGRWDLAVNLILPASRTLRGNLKIDEAVFRTHTFHTAPRDFVLWTALDEVEKTAMVLMRLDGFLGEDTAPSDSTDPIPRASLTMVAEELRMRARRLCELLSQLVLFLKKDEEAYYRHFLLLADLASAHWFNEDLNEFHGAASAWVEATIERTRREISAVEATVDFAHAWYAAYKPPLKADAWRGTLKNARQCLKEAIPAMTDFERMSVGSTYAEAFGQPSSSIHYAAGTDPSATATVSSLQAEATRLSFAAFCVINRCHQLLGRPNGAAIDKLVHAIQSNTEAPRLFSQLNVRPQISVGDFVLARGLLGEVIDETKTSYGYRSLRVELLAERPLPNLAADWFRARDVVPFLRRDHLVRGVARHVGQGATPTDSDLRDAARATWAAARLAGG